MNTKKNETVVDSLFDVGEAWASYGLRVAELALTTSARSLTSVSKVLGHMADELKDEQAKKEVIDAPVTQ